MELVDEIAASVRRLSVHLMSISVKIGYNPV